MNAHAAPSRTLQPESEWRATEPWWLAAADIAKSIEEQEPEPKNSTFYQFGDGVLQITSEYRRLLDTFDRLYGDCAVPESVACPPLVHCVARRGRDVPLLLLTFNDGAPRDAASAFLPKRATHVWDSPLPGWRLTGVGNVPMLAACGSHVLIDARQTWRRFPVEYLVNATLAAQPDLIGLHAAALELHNAGLLLAGPSESGKTTTSLHLAARGAMLLGDEIALIRLATNELIPFRRTANVRSGPRAPELAAAIGRVVRDEPPIDDDADGATVRIGDLFPRTLVRSANLRAAFFLDGFADRPSLAPFRLTLHDLETFGVLAGHEIATLWGLPLERRALRLMVVKHLLDRLPCWLLKVGGPAETAGLIERTMEDLRC